MHHVSFPLMINLMYSCNERFIPSADLFVQGAGDVRGLCLILSKWHSVMISLFTNSVPLSVSSIAGSPNLATQSL